MIAFAHQFDPTRDHADFSANGWGIIGDSQDKRYTYCRTDWRIDGRPDYIIEIDWHALRDRTGVWPSIVQEAHDAR